MLSGVLPRRTVGAGTLFAAAVLAVACGSSSGAATGTATTTATATTTTTATATPTTITAGGPGGGSGGADGSGGHARSPARDVFKARIAAARGAWARTTGHLILKLHVTPAHDADRPLRLTLVGRLCRPGCAGVRGTVAGSLTAEQRALPDTGSAFALRARGVLKPFGRLTAVGTVHGTGFIAHGHELLRLTLSGAGGTLEIVGRSGPVPPFTSP